VAQALPSTAPGRLTAALERVPAPAWVIAFLLLLMPAFANNFVLFQIFGWSFILGMIALSLMVLAGYGGMVSLSQMTVGALAGYVVAILGTSGVPQISLGWPWWLHIPLAILIEHRRELPVGDGTTARHGPRRAVDLERGGQARERHQLVGVGDRVEAVARAEHAHPRRGCDDGAQLVTRRRAVQPPRAVDEVAGPVALAQAA
jgi:hypothetical protein